MAESREKEQSLKRSELIRAMMSLSSEIECERFLNDLCTPQELNALADRWLVAKLLDQKIPYRKIYEITGVSTATITRVARALEYGEGGYRTILRRRRDNEKYNTNRIAEIG